MRADVLGWSLLALVVLGLVTRRLPSTPPAITASAVATNPAPGEEAGGAAPGGPASPPSEEEPRAAQGEAYRVSFTLLGKTLYMRRVGYLPSADFERYQRILFSLPGAAEASAVPFIDACLGRTWCVVSTLLPEAQQRFEAGGFRVEVQDPDYSVLPAGLSPIETELYIRLLALAAKSHPGLSEATGLPLGTLVTAVSDEHLAAAIGRAVRTVQRLLERLEDRGVLSRRHVPAQGTRVIGLTTSHHMTSMPTTSRSPRRRRHVSHDVHGVPSYSDLRSGSSIEIDVPTAPPPSTPRDADAPPSEPQGAGGPAVEAARPLIAATIATWGERCPQSASAHLSTQARLLGVSRKYSPARVMPALLSVRTAMQQGRLAPADLVSVVVAAVKQPEEWAAAPAAAPPSGQPPVETPAAAAAPAWEPPPAPPLWQAVAAELRLDARDNDLWWAPIACCKLDEAEALVALCAPNLRLREEFQRRLQARALTVLGMVTPRQDWRVRWLPDGRTPATDPPGMDGAAKGGADDPAS